LVCQSVSKLACQSAS